MCTDNDENNVIHAHSELTNLCFDRIYVEQLNKREVIFNLFGPIYSINGTILGKFMYSQQCDKWPLQQLEK